MPTPSEQLRQAIQDVLTKSKMGARSFELKHGLRKWALRGLLDPVRRQSPSVDKAKELCEALGLEFYIGPPRKGALKELQEKLLTPEEMAQIPPEVQQALEDIIYERDKSLWREAVESLEKALREAKKAADRFDREILLNPNNVPVDTVRALGLPPDCTAEEALTAMGEALAKIERQRHAGDDTPSGPDEYVPVLDFNDKEAFAVRRLALDPWVDTRSLTFTVASSDEAHSLETSICDGDFVILDDSWDGPVHGALFAFASDYPDIYFDIGRTFRVGDNWLMFSGVPGKKSRTLGKYDILIGRVAWHGPKTSPDLRGTVKEPIDLSIEEWMKRSAAHRTSKTREAKPAAELRVNSKK